MSKATAAVAKPTVAFDAHAISQIVEEEIQLRRYGTVGEIQGKAAKASEVFSAWEQDRDSISLISSSLTHTDKLTAKMVRSCSPRVWFATLQFFFLHLF